VFSIPYLLEQLAIGMASGAIYAIVAIGFNLVFGVLNVLNMAMGATMMVGSYGLLLGLYLGISNFWLAMIVGIFVALATGLTVERVAVRPLKENWWNIKVATIGFALFLENLVTRLTDGRPTPYPRPFDIKYYSIFGLFELSNVQLFLVGFSVLLLLLMVVFLYRTTMGKAVRVIAQNRDLAQCLGIDVRRITVVTFGISAVLAGIAGMLNSIAFASTYPFVGQQLGLKAVVVLIVAGIGNMRGCLYVGVGLGILESLAVGFGQSTYRDFIAYGGMILVLLARPHGLFGEEARVKEI
jgi:branched-chain amino acid transport system permease protein